MPELIPEEVVQAVAEKLYRDYDSEFGADHLSWRDFEGQARELLSVAAPLIAEQARVEERAVRDNELAVLREEVEEDARVMRALRRHRDAAEAGVAHLEKRVAHLEKRAEVAEALLGRVREAHHVHRCDVDGHVLDRTPNPCVNDRYCSCGRRDCPTLAIVGEVGRPEPKREDGEHAEH
jgi:hypothetical protein